jgi:uncharacterized protein (TIGR00255 family)
MTGFGSASSIDPLLEASATVRTVNHRFLDLSVHLPRRVAGLEPEVRRRVQARLARGKIEVAVSARFAAGTGGGVRAADALVKSLVTTLRWLKEEYRLAGDVSVSDIARFPGALESGETASPAVEAELQAVLNLLEQALEAVDAMRRTEGEGLGRDLLDCLDGLARCVVAVRDKTEAGKTERRALLTQKVRELTEGLALDEARLTQEVARLVERSDVSEELHRLESHIAQCRSVVGAAGPSGKQLDFLAQELARETNTIGSKAVSAEVVGEVVAMKALVERFREQVQNVE